MKKTEKKLRQIWKETSFIKKFVMALLIYLLSVLLGNIKICSIVLKVLTVCFLLGRNLKEELSKLIDGKQNTQNFIILSAIFMLLLIKKFDEACISAFIFYLKEIIRKQHKKKTRSKLLNDRNNVKKGDTLTFSKGDIVYFDGILKSPKAYFLDNKEKRIVKRNKEKISAGVICCSNNIKIKVEVPYEETEYYLLNKKKEKVMNSFSKKEEMLKQIYSFYKVVIFTIASIYLFLLIVLDLNVEIAAYNILLLLVLPYIIDPLKHVNNLINNVVEQIFIEQIIVKDKKALEKINKVKNYIFEKTKTLTIADFRITEITTEDEEELFYYLNYGEYFSNHPIKDAILKYKSIDIDPTKIKAYKSYPNKGIYYKIDNHDVLIGNSRLMKEKEIDINQNFGIGTVIYVAVDNVDIGNILISDGIKYRTKETISKIKRTKPNHMAILSSDNEKITTAIAKELKIKDHYSNLTKLEKIFWIRHLKENHEGLTMFVGSSDTNLEVLKEADISVCLIEKVKDIREDASIVLLNNDLSKLINLYNLVKNIDKKQNCIIILTASLGLILTILCFFKYLPLWMMVIITCILEIFENK